MIVVQGVKHREAQLRTRYFVFYVLPAVRRTVALDTLSRELEDHTVAISMHETTRPMPQELLLVELKNMCVKEILLL